METTYSVCPLCGSEELKFALKAKDYSVSHEEFEIWQCDSCTLRFTQNAPDTQAIGKYYQSADYISHSNSRRGFFNKIYHFVREFTLDAKKRLIYSLTGLKKGKLLDIGAGTGYFAQFMQQGGWSVTGLEPSEEARARALRSFGITLEPPDYLGQLPDGSFDVITMWHVLEHVHDLHGYLVQLRRLVKPHGKIFIAVPNYTSFDASFYRQYWAAYDVPRHLYHFSPVAMKALLQRHDLELQSTRSMPYDSFYVSLLSEKYKKAALGVVRAFFVGLYSNLKAFVTKERSSSLIYIVDK